ncbi:MAG: DUF4037 domain-containing protein [Clostridium sp.]|nr:DUF4037 domain-containing protein [Clostridium sp.]
MNIEELWKELAAIPEVEAIALGGSRAGSVYDEKSDYDIYLYCTGDVEESVRREILSRYCKVMEIGNHFWEYEDNCTLKNGIDMDILYRNLEAFVGELALVVEQYQPHNGYTTCMWHNLLNSKILYDENGNLAAAKERFAVPYPEPLKQNIIERNKRLLHTAMPAYDAQIGKAVARMDFVSINHRVAAFMESYFDIIFARNGLTHPGEKRLVQLCRQQCECLPERFEENINALFADLFCHMDRVGEDIEEMIRELNKIL